MINHNKFKIDYFLFFISYIIVIFLSSYINKFVYRILPYAEIKIESLEKNSGDINYITLLEDEETSLFYNLKNIYDKNIEKRNNLIGLNYIKKGENNYSVNALSSNNSENIIYLKLKKTPRLKLIFYNIGAGKKIKISSNGKKSEILDLSNEKEGEIINYFPFSESKIFLLYTISSYIFFGFIIYLILGCIKKIYKKIDFTIFFKEYNFRRTVLIIYVIISLYVTFQFIFKTLPLSLFQENGQLFGDQSYYWNIGISIRNLELEEIKMRAYSFRGYITSVIPLLSQEIGKYTRINPLWIFYMINNIFTSILLGYIVPEIHQKLTGKKTKYYHVVALFIIFSFFWKGMYYSVLVDILGGTFLLWMILKILDKKNKKDVFLIGIFGGIAALCRGNYILTVISLAFGCFIYDIYKRKKVYVQEGVIFLLGLLIVCIPQIGMNYLLGHIGIFPFDHVGSYVPKEKLSVFLINQTMREYFVGWPVGRGNITAQQILKNFSNDARLSMNQIFSAFIFSPKETIIMSFKKIFFALDTRSSETYPIKLWNLEFFSFINYFIISTSLFFIGMKKIYRKEKILGLFLLIFGILPQVILSVEWRYYILLYLMVYYIFIFKYIALIETKYGFKKIKEQGYLKFVILMIILCFMISSYYV